MVAPGDVLTGARARFLLGTTVLGYATNVTVNEAYQYEAINVLDNLEVQEHVPVGYDVSMTAAHVRLINRSLRSPQFGEPAGRAAMPEIGVDAQAHLANLVGYDLTPLEAILEDPISQSTFMLMSSVKVQSRNFTVSARGVIGEDISFVGIRVRDEVET